MNREARIWKGIAPIIGALAVLLFFMASDFDRTEVETLASIGGLLRAGLPFQTVRGLIRDMLDAYEGER